MKSTAERRMAIMAIMCERRYETMANLASEFSVDRRTIRRDKVCRIGQFGYQSTTVKRYFYGHDSVANLLDRITGENGG